MPPRREIAHEIGKLSVSPAEVQRSGHYNPEIKGVLYPGNSARATPERLGYLGMRIML